MSKTTRDWAHRLENYDGDDTLVEARYAMFILKEKADDLAEALHSTLFVPHLIRKMGDAEETFLSIGLYAEECVADVIECWITEHKWWDAFTRWVISEIEYAQLNAG